MEHFKKAVSYWAALDAAGQAKKLDRCTAWRAEVLELQAVCNAVKSGETIRHASGEFLKEIGGLIYVGKELLNFHHLAECEA